MDQALSVFLVSLWDVRVAMPLAVYLGLKPWQSFLLGSSGALVIAPFLLIFQELLRIASKGVPRLVSWIFVLNAKNRSFVEKYGYLGLLLFVILPVPGTGAWAGALIAGLLQMDVWKSFLVILVGIFISGALSMSIADGLSEVWYQLDILTYLELRNLFLRV